MRSQVEYEPEYKITIKKGFHPKWDNKVGLVWDGTDLCDICIPMVTIAESKICKLKRFPTFT